MLANKRILVVDDSITIRMFVRNLLASKGALVHDAECGKGALALCDSGQPYDLIVLDLILPDMHGIDVLSRIRETNDVSAIVMLTEMGGVKSAMAAVQHGADGYIEKRELSLGGDFAEFFYPLKQAMEHRSGLVAQKQLQKIRADFYSMVTHDLRNPAGATVLAISLLMDERTELLSTRQRELLRMAKVSSQKLLSLINDYLDFAKIESGYLHLKAEVIDLRRLVESSAELERLQAQARSQALVIDLPPGPVYASVDGDLLRQVLDNLISNAVKYTPEGGRITVQLRTEGAQAILSVADNGMGIPLPNCRLSSPCTIGCQTRQSAASAAVASGCSSSRKSSKPMGVGLRPSRRGYRGKGPSLP